MTSTLDDGLDEESWGIRDFFLFIGKCAKHCSACKGPGVQECTKCEKSHKLENGKCKEDINWYIIEKNFFGEEKFKNLSGWEFNNFDGTPFSECGKINLVGGFDKFGKNVEAVNTLKNLPKHRRLRLKI